MVIFRELLPNPGSGVAVNDEKRHTDIVTVYLVTDEGYPPKLLIFAGIGLNQEVTTEMRRQARTDKTKFAGKLKFNDCHCQFGRHG